MCTSTKVAPYVAILAALTSANPSGAETGSYLISLDAGLSSRHGDCATKLSGAWVSIQGARLVRRRVYVGPRITYVGPTANVTRVPEDTYLRCSKRSIAAGASLSYPVMRDGWIVIPEACPAVTLGVRTSSMGVAGREPTWKERSHPLSSGVQLGLAAGRRVAEGVSAVARMGVYIPIDGRESRLQGQFDDEFGSLGSLSIGLLGLM